MTITLRVVLVVGSLLLVFFVARQVRKGKIGIDYSLFWILLSVFLLVTSIFPQYLVFLTHLLGVYSTSNMVFLLVIGILVIKLFTNSVKLSKLENRLESVVQEAALKDVEVKMGDKSIPQEISIPTHVDPDAISS